MPGPDSPAGAGDTPNPAPAGPDDWINLSHLLLVMAHYADKAGRGSDRTSRQLGANRVRKLTPDLARSLDRLGVQTVPGGPQRPGPVE